MEICIKGARAICKAVGESPKDILWLVETRGLPAWKREGCGGWRALPEDLKRWVKAERTRELSAQADGIVRDGRHQRPKARRRSHVPGERSRFHEPRGPQPVTQGHLPELWVRADDGCTAGISD